MCASLHTQLHNTHPHARTHTPTQQAQSDPGTNPQAWCVCGVQGFFGQTIRYNMWREQLTLTHDTHNQKLSPHCNVLGPCTHTHMQRRTRGHRSSYGASSASTAAICTWLASRLRELLAGRSCVPNPAYLSYSLTEQVLCRKPPVPRNQLHVGVGATHTEL